MTTILGISGLYHNAAAALVVDGTIVAAAQEERFSRKKNDPSFPVQAISYCLRAGGLTAGDLDFVAYHEKPWLHFDRLLQTYLRFAPRGLSSFVAAMPPWLGGKLYVRRMIRRALGRAFKGGIAFCEHHESHAASAFYPSPHEEAAIVTTDGVGEWATASVGFGRGTRVELTHELHFPHSLGLLYAAFTQYLGFEVNEGEYKMMGLAPYGEPRFAQLIREHLIDLRADGSFRLATQYFEYATGRTMIGGRFERLLGQPRRAPESEITQFHMDVAASIQVVTEEAVLGLARFAHETTGASNLCMAGGVALNCVANGRLLRESAFDHVWVQPAADDAGGALGAALVVWHQLLGRPRAVARQDAQRGSLLGPSFSAEEIRAVLDEHGVVYRELASDDELLGWTTKRLEAGSVVGWFWGRMEFGPRALGARSILADPRRPEMCSKLNQKIKFRESFRPFAPVVLHEHAHEWFDVPDGFDSPYMAFTAEVAEGVRVEVDDEPEGLDRLQTVRSKIPAVTHVDGSARLQTVDAGRHGRFCELLRRFHFETGCPVLLNTSFNVRDEPIVCTPADALRCFARTDMDALVLEGAVILRSEQSSATLERASA